MTKVFVYGSLRNGQALSYVLESCDCFNRKAITRKEFTLYSLGAFPALVNKGDTEVVGEVYEVSDEILDLLDRIEGHPHFYTRTPITLSDGMEVQSYLLNNTPIGCKVVKNGDWVEYNR